MRKRQQIRVFFGCLFLAVWMVRCATLSSPDGWLPKLNEAQSLAYGGWITVEHFDENQTKKTFGELIAAQEDNLIILGEEGIAKIPVEKIRKGKLEVFKEKRVAGVWAVLGTLSTLSHGIGLLLTAPVWIISGIGFAVAESMTGLMEFQGPPPEEVRKFARFPQGLPKDIDLQSLKAKPFQNR